MRHGTAIPPHLEARDRRVTPPGLPGFRLNQQCCFVAVGALDQAAASGRIQQSARPEEDR